ncbi:MAG: enoyl-CoA hydratase [Burkholderiales bacterium]
MESLVLSQDLGNGIVRLTLNRPQAFNSLSESLLAALQAELERLDKDPAARVVILAAAGKAYCTGHDLREMRADPSQEYYERLFTTCARMMMTIQHLTKPVIAEVQGVATAAGCQLVAMCDLAVAAAGSRFAVSGINLGLFCSTPSVALSRNVSRKRALEMLLTGDFISAEEARDYGLINRVVPPDELQSATEALALRIAAKPQIAIEMGKRLFYAQLETGIEQAYHLAGETMACNMMHPDTLEGVQAFLEKRPPSWAK